MTKRCPRCTETKPLDAFGLNRRRTDGHSSYCRPCAKEVSAIHMRANRDRRRAANRAAQHRTRRKHKALLFRYLSDHPCTDCGESDPVVLDLHHIGPKVLPVTDMVRGAFSWSVIQAEIAKCVVVCANCHRRRHHRQRSQRDSTDVSPPVVERRLEQ
jgi:hypothetical protein